MNQSSKVCVCVCAGAVRSCCVAQRAADHGAGVQRGGRHVRHGRPSRLHPVSAGPAGGTEAADGVSAPQQTHR